MQLFKNSHSLCLCYPVSYIVPQASMWSVCVCVDKEYCVYSVLTTVLIHCQVGQTQCSRQILMELHRKKHSVRKEVKEKWGEERRGQGVCLFRWDSSPLFFKTCSHFTELKKKGHGSHQGRGTKTILQRWGRHFQESGNVSWTYGCVTGFTVYVWVCVCVGVCVHSRAHILTCQLPDLSQMWISVKQLDSFRGFRGGQVHVRTNKTTVLHVVLLHVSVHAINIVHTCMCRRWALSLFWVWLIYELTSVLNCWD